MYFLKTFLSIVALALVSRALSIPSGATSGTSDIVIDTVEYLNHQWTIESASANELDTLSSYRRTIESTGADELDTLSSYRRTIESTGANELDTLNSYRRSIESTGADELDTLSSYRRTPSNKVVFEETDILNF